MFSTKRIVSPFPTPKLDCHHDIKAGFWLAEIKHLVNNCHCYYEMIIFLIVLDQHTDSWANLILLNEDAANTNLIV
jgi:hypothetical protein